MGERKVLNKYYPPDFDPAKIPRRKQPKNLQMKVRMMLPMSIRCTTCGNYIYKGTKFNCRKEDVIGETYMGILIFRFYFKCTKCSAELVMKTDPQNSDYIMESGASRNFEPWREKDEAADKAKKERDAEEMGNAMKALENRTLDSKQEMDIMAALDEMKSMRSRQAGIDTTAMLEALRRSKGEPSAELPDEDEALIKSVMFRNSASYVHRIDDDEDGADGQEHSLKRGTPPTIWLESTNGGAPSSTAQDADETKPNPKRPRVDAAQSEQDRGSNGTSTGAGPESSRPAKPAAPAPVSFQARPPKPAAFVVKPKAAQPAGTTGARVQGSSVSVKAEQKSGSSNSHAAGNGASSAPPATAILSSLSAYGSDDED